MGVTNYIWDPVDDAVLMETDENDATTAVYTHRPQQHGNLISQRRGENTSFYHYDGLGSTAAVTDESEAVTDTYCYKAFGEPASSTGSTVNPFRWVGSLGYYWDEELGQYYVRARHYKPHSARWLSPDPIGYNGGDVNLYEYVQSAPTMYVDPSGTRVVITCKARSQVRSGLDDISVTGYVLKEGEILDEYSGETTQFRMDQSWSEIAGSMIKSGQTFKIKGDTAQEAIENWRKHINARRHIIAAAESKGFRFSNRLIANASAWVTRNVRGPDGKVIGQTTSALYRRDLFSAIGDIWANPTEYAVGCQAAIRIVMLRGISLAMGQAAFNNVAPEYPWGAGGDSLLRKNTGITDTDWVPGDWGGIVNKDPAPKPDEQGHNLIYIGNNRWSGHTGAQRVEGPLTGDGSWFEIVRNWGVGARIATWRRGPKLGLEEDLPGVFD